MKKINLLAPIVLATSVAPLVSCQNINPLPTADDIYHFIYDPTNSEITPPFHEGDTYKEYLLANKDNKQLFMGEIYYDLFGEFNKTGVFGLESKDSFISLYNAEDSCVMIKTLLRKIAWDFNDNNELIISFNGYVGFQFIKDYCNDEGDHLFEAGDYVIMTYQLEDLKVEFFEERPTVPKDSLLYWWNQTEKSILGIVDIKQLGKSMPLQSIFEVKTKSLPVPNSKNWSLE